MNANRPIRQASWRTRRQRIGGFLLVIVSSVMVAALYLGIASQATLAGREIQTLEREISKVREENANLKTELARALAYRKMETREKELGYHPASAEETHYIYVPGYAGQQNINIGITAEQENNQSSLPEEYSLSLFDWVEMQTRRGPSR